MSTLLLEGQTLIGDATVLDDAAPIPAQGELIVSPARWEAERDALLNHAGAVAVEIANTVDVLELPEDLLALPMLALQFPAFGDGRAYSQARLLRERRGYRGDLRAVGNAVVRDQLGFMARCGFTSFQLRADQDPDVCRRAFTDFSAAYQPAADRTAPAWLRFGRVTS